MRYSRKGIQSYFYVIITVSLLISFLLFFIIGITYKSDHQMCQQIAYSFSLECKNPSGYTIEVTNNGRMPISFEANGKIKEGYYLPAGEEKRLTITSDSSTARVRPVVFDENNTGHVCKSKQEGGSVEVLGTC